jgi:peptidoglycan/LPS O-acetylase OafA/YrhL
MLMTGIVVSGLEAGRFSISGFYMARGRRIVPALVFLCAVLLAVGWWLLPLADYEGLGTQTFFSVAFLSNVKFWLEAGYFDASSHEKWLLHTWSLAVEWQFYLLLPLALAIVWKLRPGRGALLVAVMVGALASLALSAALSPMRPSGSFFMLPTRAWEMLGGSLVYFMAVHLKMSKLQKQCLEIAGFVFIVTSIGIFDVTNVWSGSLAIWPMLGAMMVLLAARSQSLFTANPVAQWLGTRSYSIYLWHWPVVVALRYADKFDQPSAVAAGIGVTCLLGHISYRWVEVPCRQSLTAMKQSKAVALLVGISVAMAALGGVVAWQKGFPGRMPRELGVVSQEVFNSNPRKGQCHPSFGVDSPSCTYGNGPLAAIMLGDSHGDALVTGLAQATQQRGSTMQWTYSACPTLAGVHNMQVSRNQCSAFVDWAFERLQSIPVDVPVIVVNRHAKYALGNNEDSVVAQGPWVFFTQRYKTPEPAFLREYAQHLTDTACRLAKTHRVYVVRPIPEMGVSVPSTARAMVWGIKKEVTLSLEDYHARNDFAWEAQNFAQAQCGMQILDPLPYLCWDGVCHGAKEGRPLYYDDNHLGEFGNKLLVPMFERVLEQSS